MPSEDLTLTTHFINNKKKYKIMKTYKITKNGNDLVNGLTKEEALDKLFPMVEDYSDGYIYDNEAETIYNEVTGQVYATKGDDYVGAGDDLFEIVEE